MSPSFNNPSEKITGPMMHPKYRPDIDGLRAIAVLAVVLFHAFPGSLPGGFVGVDVFFVISGFLISGILFSNLEKDRFSYIEFYNRRIKRIFPALIVVMAVSLAFGWLILFPDEYSTLGRHTAAGAGFVANLALWQEANYFDAAAASKPLLHLWSLGIEEQFYLVWPVILGVLWKQRHNLLVVTLVIAAASFLFNLYSVGTDETAAYYSPLTRFWELMLGGILAHLVQHKPHHLPENANVQSLAGLILLALGFWLVDKGVAFPGWWALLPTLGTLLLISAGSDAWLNRHLLSNRLMVSIGLISYPVYLWHWPLLSYAHLLEAGTPSWEVRVAAVVGGFGLAWATYRWVEGTIRPRRDKATPLYLLAGMVLVGLVGWVIHRQDGVTSRIPTTIELYLDTRPVAPAFEEFSRCGQEFAALKPFMNYCWLSGPSPNAVLIGDSHAAHLFSGLAHNDETRTWALMGAHSCPPTLGVFAQGSNANCEERFTRLLQHLEKTPWVDTVAFSFYGAYTANSNYAADHVERHRGPKEYILEGEGLESKKEALLFGLEQSVGSMLSAGKKVYLLTDIPEFPFFPRNCVQRPNLHRPIACSVERSAVDARQDDIRSILKTLAQRHPRLAVFDPIALICNDEECGPIKSDRSLYRDSHHLSAYGSDVVGRAFLDWAERQSEQ